MTRLALAGVGNRAAILRRRQGVRSGDAAIGLHPSALPIPLADPEAVLLAAPAGRVAMGTDYLQV